MELETLRWLLTVSFAIFTTSPFLFNIFCTRVLSTQVSSTRFMTFRSTSNLLFSLLRSSTTSLHLLHAILVKKSRLASLACLACFTWAHRAPLHCISAFALTVASKALCARRSNFLRRARCFAQVPRYCDARRLSALDEN